MNRRKMNRRQTSWSNLPPALLFAIARRLETRSDILKFRAVCKNWRQSATKLLHKNMLSPLLPHKILTPSPPLLNKKGSSPEFQGNSLLLVASSVFLLQSSQNPELPPWLITVEEVNPGKFYLRKPLSRVNIKDLPENFPKVLDLSDLKVTEIGNFCNLRLADKPLDMFQRMRSKNFRNKVILFVDPNCKNTPKIRNCTAMVLYDMGSLSAIRLKNEKEKYINPKGRKVEDILNFKGKLYAVDRRGRAYRMDYKSLSMREIVDKPLSDASPTDDKKYHLAELWGEVYLVHKCLKFGTKFHIYRLKEKEKEWEEVEEGIRDSNVLFVTYDGCFLARTKDFPGWRGNSIVYYNTNTFPLYDVEILDDFGKKDDRLDIGVFNHGCDISGWDIAYSEVSELYCDVFWPPPAWLLPGTNLSTSTSEEEDEELESDSSGQSTHVEISQFAGDIQNVPMDITSAKTAQNVVYKGNIPGVSVSPQFVPTLNKIWDKHGNVIPQPHGRVMRNKDQLKSALESLAKTVMLLQSPSGMYLNNSEVAYINSTVYKLQCMHFKLDWLYPFIQKALALHNRQQQLDFIKGLEMSKTNLLEQLRDVECGLAKHRKLAEESFVPPVELKNMLS